MQSTGEINTPNSLIGQTETESRMSVDGNNNPQTIQNEPTTIDWNYMGLTKIPKPIYAQRQHFLKVLDLSRNELRELPESLVTALPNLECLDVSNNRLKALPTNIGNWTYLQDVNAAWNKIVTVPVSMVENLKLEYLNLGGNPLNEYLISYFDRLPEVWNVRFCELFAKEIQLLLLEMKWATERRPNRFRGQEDPIPIDIAARNLQTEDQTFLPIKESAHPIIIAGSNIQIEDEVEEDPIPIDIAARNLQTEDQTVLPIKESAHPIIIAGPNIEIEDEVEEDPIPIDIAARNVQTEDQTVLPIKESAHPIIIAGSNIQIEDEVVLPIEEPFEELNGTASGQSVAPIQEIIETEATAISFSNSSILTFLASKSNSANRQPFTKPEMEAHFNIKSRKNRTVAPKSNSEPALRKKKSLSVLITEANDPNRIRRFDLLRSFLVMILLAILDVIQVVTYLACAVFAVIVSLGLLADLQLIRSWMEWWGILKFIPTGVQSGAQFLFSLFGAHFASISIYVPIYRSAPNGFFSACVTLLAAGFRYFLDSWAWRAFYNYIL